MMEENNHIIYSAADIEKYWRGELTAAEQHAMEKAAMEDPLLADAMEGYEKKAQVPERVIGADNNELSKRLAERVAEKQSIPVIRSVWWKAAAAIVVLFAAGWLYTGINNKAKQDSVAKNEINKQRTAPVKTDTNSLQTEAVAGGDTFHDIAVNKSRRPAAKDDLPAKKEKDKDAAAETGVAPVATSGKPTAVKPGAAQLADSSGMDKEDVAKLAERKEELSSPVEAAKPEQKAKSVFTDDNTMKKYTLAGRASNFSNTFNGNVMDQSNQPVANAAIQIPNLNVATKTDNKGYFSFKAPDTTLSVSIAANGFETQNLNLRNNKAMLNQIVLKPDQYNLGEVVVQSNGSVRKKQAAANDISIKILDAEPVNGWAEYNTYLQKNKKVSEENSNIHGTVVVSFEVHNKWLNNFTIVQSLDEDLDAEAIRLVKEGPAWKLLKGKKAVATVTVKF